MSMIPPAILEFRKEIRDSAQEAGGPVISDERIQQILSESEWTIEQLDFDIKEHCLAKRALSANGKSHFYEYLAPVDMPPVG